MDEINSQDQVEIEREHNEQCALRREKLGQLRAAGQAYPNDFTRDAFALDLHRQITESQREKSTKP